MNCRKNCCENVLIIDKTIESGDQYLLTTTTSTVTPKNCCKYVIVIPCRLLSNITSMLAVNVDIDGELYPLRDFCCGNNVYTDQLRFIPTNCKDNKVIRVVFGDDEPHFKIISQKLPQTIKEILPAPSFCKQTVTVQKQKTVTKKDKEEV